MLGFEGERVSPELGNYLARGLAGVVIYRRNFLNAEGLRELAGEIRRAAGRPVALLLTFINMLACRLIWPNADLSLSDLGHVWIAAICVGIAAMAMLGVDYYATFTVGNLDRTMLEGYFDPRGLDAKYASASASLTRSTRPRIRTCRCSCSQPNAAAATGRARSCSALALVRLV